MRTIIAGSRGLTDPDLVRLGVGLCGWEVTEVVSGGATGIDMLGELWAHTNNIPVRKFPADWSQGKGAGFARNKEMADYAEALIAIWDGKSRGTNHMVETAREKGLKVFVMVEEPGPEPLESEWPPE